jgi:hypothetical protein
MRKPPRLVAKFARECPVDHSDASFLLPLQNRDRHFGSRRGSIGPWHRQVPQRESASALRS